MFCESFQACHKLREGLTIFETNLVEGGGKLWAWNGFSLESALGSHEYYSKELPGNTK